MEERDRERTRETIHTYRHNDRQKEIQNSINK